MALDSLRWHTQGGADCELLNVALVGHPSQLVNDARLLPVFVDLSQKKDFH